MQEKAFVGCLLGTAVGDSLGLPYEGIPKARLQRRFRDFGHHRFLWDRGMVSDDTEHSAMTALTILQTGYQPSEAGILFASYLRWWLLCVPAGVGWATLRSIIRLYAGTSPRDSGVFSAGNGPAMRAPIIGVCFGHDAKKLEEMVETFTLITHSDPKAEAGALAIANAAFIASQIREEPLNMKAILTFLRGRIEKRFPEMSELIQAAFASAEKGESTEDFAFSQGIRDGVSGYMYHTVPCVFQAWFKHPTDFRGAMIELIRCGGDTDTTCAILGGIMGSVVGEKGIPEEWMDGICDYPWNRKSLTALGKALFQSRGENKPQSAPMLIYPLIFFRNLFFFAVVLVHGVRRLFPPY